MSKTIGYTLNQTEQTQNFIYDFLMKQFKNLFVKRIKIKGVDDLGDLITNDIIMELLFDNGKALFFKDANYGFMCLKATPYDKFNVNGKPRKFMAHGVNYEKTYDLDHSVLIKLNDTMLPLATPISYYVAQMVEIEMTKKLRRNAHKTPVVLETTPETELSARNVFKNLATSQPVTYKNKSKSGEGDIGINVLNMDVTYINNLLDDEYNTYLAKILTLLGLDNYTEDKAERVQSAEVTANEAFIKSMFNQMVENLTDACEKINKMYGLNLSIEFDDIFIEEDNNEENKANMEGEDE